MVLIATFDIPDDLKAPSVSVPLRGLWFLSADEQKIKEEVEQFGFRPLTGIMVLIVMYWPELHTKTPAVSVPLRGLWFLSINVSYASMGGNA